MSRPHTTADPVTAGCGWVGSRPRSDNPSTLLPEPDSPTRPRISPRPIDMDTPLTADTVRPLRSNDTWRSSTVTTGAPRPVLYEASSSTGPGAPRLSLVEGAGDTSGWNDMAAAGITWPSSKGRPGPRCRPLEAGGTSP